MNDKTKKLILNVINEDAVQFKNNFSKVIYEKISDRLKLEYKNISKKLFENTVISPSQGGQSTTYTTYQGDYGAEVSDQNLQQSYDTNLLGDLKYSKYMAQATKDKKEKEDTSGPMPPPPSWWPGRNINWNSLSDDEKQRMYDEYLDWWKEWVQWRIKYQKANRGKGLPAGPKPYYPRDFFDRRGWYGVPDWRDLGPGQWSQPQL